MAFVLSAARKSIRPVYHVTSRRPASVTNLLHLRTMASAARKFEFLVVIPDVPGMLEKRLEVRSKHFEGLTPNIESGTFKMGGAVLNSVPKDDEASSLDFAGSTLVLVAESKEEVLETLKKDIYAKSGVWDLEKAQIWPFKCAFRHP
ncbi:hypothetical protein GQ53DRAFT_745761 [Thozetella sp. PMI_491]|nr:hypothetical protein GQ53DRAFT_745761 [Thozetella sp. PMI_491]